MTIGITSLDCNTAASSLSLACLPTIRSFLLARQPASFSLIINSCRTYSFDPSGRPVSLVIDDRYFSRSLSGAFKEKSWKGARSVFDRYLRDVPPAENQILIQILQEDLRHVYEAVVHRSIVPKIHDACSPGLAQQDISEFLTHLIQRMTNLASEEKRFTSLYKPISILPPDQYFTIVLQVAEGCSWNRCTFCDFYHDRAFRIRPKQEWLEHFNQVQSFFGEGVRLRNSIFLADANAFIMKTPDLLDILKEVHQRFPGQAGPEGRGVVSFADVPAILGKKSDELLELKKAGLRRLYIGMETGADAIRRMIKKPGSADAFSLAVHKVKKSGMSVGLIVMLGLGGREKSGEHVNETLRLLQTFALDVNDIVFFSPYYPSEESEYFRVACEQGWKALDRGEMERQYFSFQNALRQDVQCHARIGVYDVHEFIY